MENIYNLQVEGQLHGNLIITGYYNGSYYKLNCWGMTQKDAIKSFKKHVIRQDSLNFYNEPSI